MKTPYILSLLILLLTLPATAQGYWKFRTTNYERRLNTPGPKQDIRGAFAGQGLTIDDSFEDSQGRRCHTKFQAGWNWSRPSLVLNPGTKLKVVVSTDASQENWPNPFGSATVWVDSAHKIVELVRTRPAGPQQGEGTLEIPAGDPDSHKEMTIGLYASHAGEMWIIHVYDWKSGSPPATSGKAAPTPPDGGPSTSKIPLTGLWKGTWRNSVGETGTDTLNLKEDASGNLSGTWSGNVPVSGRRTDNTHLQLRGRTSTRDFQIQGVLQEGSLKLTYVARRLNGSGSYQGESSFTRGSGR